MFVQHVIEMASKSTEKADRKNTKGREIREAEKKERKKERKKKLLSMVLLNRVSSTHKKLYSLEKGGVGPLCVMTP